MSFASNITDGFVRVATEFRALRTLIGGSATATIGALTTTNKTSLVDAINEVKASADAAASSGGAKTLDELTDVVIGTAASAPVAGHILRHDGASFTNVLGSTYFQPADSDLTAIAALATTAYGRAFLTLVDQAALTALLPIADATTNGLIELATGAEVTAGTDATRAVTPATLQSKLSGYQAAGSYQPLDSDLTAIAALTTTAYGRAFLALADQNALMGLLASASTTVAGKVLLATTAQGQTGTDTANAMTAAATKAAIDQRIVADNTLGGATPSTTNAPSVSSVKAYADALIGANDAMVFKGVIDASTSPNYPAANRGDTYKISVAGKIGGASGPNVEVGDLIICTTDGTVAGTQATVGANWTIVQTNIDGAVTGPTSSVSGNLASFNGTGGKTIQDSGFSVDNDGALTANSATRVPTQQAVKTFAQPKDATLTALAGLTTAADQMIYSTGVDTFAMTSVTSFARTLLDDTTQAAMQTTLGVVSTTDIGSVTTDFVAAFNTALTA